MAEKKKVVVVGGGVAGSKIAKELEEFMDVTLIDPKTYYEIPFPQPRCTVEPAFANRSLIQYEDFLKTAKHVQSTVENATAEQVITKSGETIPYDFLVITSGSTYNGPATKKERIQQFEENKKKVVDAESVLVIGGGPVGVELAAEIVTDYPKKKVTVVTSGPRLLEFLGPSVSKKVEAWLTKRGVEIIVNDHVDISDSISPPNFETRKHVAIKADAYFVTVGKKIGTGWLGTSQYLKDALTNTNRVQMEGTTQVVGFSNVFAAGDVTDYKENKEGYLAHLHADIVVNNIKMLIKNPNEKKLKVYKPQQKPGTIVSLGRKDAILALPFATFLGWVPAKLKSQDFYVSKERTDLGLKAK